MFKSKSIDGVITSISRGVEMLDKLTQHHLDLADRHGEIASDHIARSMRNKDEADRAATAAVKIKSVLDAGNGSNA